MGNYDLAIKDLTKAITLNSKDETPYIYRALANEKLKKTTGAIADYNKAITINPNNGLAYEKRGSLYFDQKKYTLALDDLNNAIKFKPTAEAYYLRGAIKDMNKDTAGACADLKTAAQMGLKEAIEQSAKICN